MARPGYNNDDSLNTYTPPSRNTWGGGGGGGRDQGNQDQQSRDQTANELDQMINRSNPDKGYDDSWESQPNNFVEPYIPPSQIYNNPPPGQRNQWTHEQFGHSPMIKDLLKNVSPEVLDFWGVSKNSQSIPVELFQSLAEGSFVSGNEAAESNEPFTTTWSQFEDTSQNLKYDNDGNLIQNYASDWLKENTLFPEGMHTYYNDMGMDRYIDRGRTTTTDNGGGGGYNYGSGSGYGNGSGYIAKPEINSYNPDFAQWGRSSVQGDFIRNQKANRGGIISLMR